MYRLLFVIDDIPSTIRSDPMTRSHSVEPEQLREEVIFTKSMQYTRAAERSFIGGGGAKTKQGHCNVKRGTKGVHADNYH